MFISQGVVDFLRTFRGALGDEIASQLIVGSTKDFALSNIAIGKSEVLFILFSIALCILKCLKIICRKELY